MTKWIIILVFFWLGPVGVAVSAEEIRRSDLPVPGQYIVVLKDKAARDPNASPGDPHPTVGKLASDMKEQFGINEVKHVYKHVLKGFSARMSEIQARELANDPRVAFIEEDGVVTAAGTSDTATNTRSGTSHAAAHVAGAGALYLGKFPTNTGAQAKQALIDNATPSKITNPGAGSPNLLLYTGFLGNTVIQDPASWGLDRIDQRNLPLSNSYSYDTTSSGVDAYIIDTGILTSHADLGGRALHVFDCTGEGAGDTNGHGTHMAATVGGSTWGVANDVNLFAVKVLNEAGEGTTACVIAGVEYVGSRSGPRVATVSVNGPFSAAFNNAIDGAIRSGALMVVAAGNTNEDACTNSPASAPLGMTVGASTSEDQRWSSSNFGTCLDIFAPGRNITSPTMDLALDHFKCYKASQGWPSFKSRDVMLVDQFEEKVTTVKRPATLCNPVDKNNEGVLTPTAQLTCFDIRDAPHQAPFETKEVMVDNQFGSQRLTVTGAQSLCVPNEKNGVASSLEVDQVKLASILELDQFKCYEVDYGGFDSLTVTLEDQFENKETVVKEPVRICNPVDNEGEGIFEPSGHLTCYSIRSPGPVGQHGSKWPRVEVENQFGVQRLLALKSETLCVPSEKTEIDPE